MNPLVSVIIPVFNAERYLEKTLDSVFAQTYSNFEVILVDDGSTDTSLAIMEKGRHDKRLKIYSQKNKGASSARNLGLKKCSGKYIQFLDADDLISKNKLEVQVSELEKQEDHIAVCRTVSFLDDEDFFNKEFPEENQYLFSTSEPQKFVYNLLGGSGSINMIQPNAYLTPINIINKVGGWRNYICPDDDGEFFCRVLLASKGIRFTANAINYYRKFKEQTSYSVPKTAFAKRNQLLTIGLKEKYLRQFFDIKDVNKIIVQHYIDFAVFAYPSFNDFSKLALRKAKRTKEPYRLPKLGGKGVEFIKNKLGWKVARIISFYFRALRYSK